MMKKRALLGWLVAGVMGFYQPLAQAVVIDFSGSVPAGSSENVGKVVDDTEVADPDFDHWEIRNPNGDMTLYSDTYSSSPGVATLKLRGGGTYGPATDIVLTDGSSNTLAFDIDYLNLYILFENYGLTYDVEFRARDANGNYVMDGNSIFVQTVTLYGNSGWGSSGGGSAPTVVNLDDNFFDGIYALEISSEDDYRLGEFGTSDPAPAPAPLLLLLAGLPLLGIRRRTA